MAKDKITLTFTIADDSYKVKGESIYDALTKIKPKNYKGFGKIIVDLNGKLSSVPIKIFPTKLRRIFALDWELRLFAKRLEALL